MLYGLRTCLFSIALLLPFSVAVGPAHGQSPATETLVFFGDRDHEPYEFLDAGKPRGASVELIEALGRQMGRKVEIRLLDWTDAQARLLAGEGHALTMLGRSPERELRYDFSRPTLPMSLSLFVRSAEAANFSQQLLAGRRIGVLAAGAPRLVLSRQHPEATLVVIDSLQAGTQALLRHEIDAVAAVTWVQLHELHRNGVTGVAGLPPFLYLQPSVAVRRGEAELLARIDAALASLEASGEVGRIVDRWSGERIYTFTGLTLRMGQIAVIVAALALLGLTFGVLLLRRQRARLAGEVRDRLIAEAAAEQRAGEARILQRMATALAGATTPDEIGQELSRLVTLLPSLPQAVLAKPREGRPGWRLLVDTARVVVASASDQFVASDAESALFDAAAAQPGPLLFGSRSELLSTVLQSSRPLPSIEGVVGEWFYVSALHRSRRSAGQRALGVLLLSWPAPPAGGHADGHGADRASLDSVAALLAQAFERAVVHRAERRAAAQQLALREAASAFAAAPDAMAVCAVVSGVADKQLGALFAALAVLEARPDNGGATDAEPMLHLLHDERMPGALADQVRRLRLAALLPMSTAARESRPSYIENRTALVAAAPDLADWPHADYIQAVAAVPLLAAAASGDAAPGRAAALGAMTMHFDHPRRFDDEDRAFIETLAAMAARAIERCQLLERLQGSLARSEEAGLRTRLAMESNGMGSWDLDLATDQVEWSERMYALLGMKPKPGGGTEAMARFFDRVHPEGEQAVREAMAQAVAGNSDFDASFRVKAEESRTRWLLGRARNLQRRGAGPATRMIGILFDITPLMQARIELEAAGRQKDEFLAMVSHELRNPLGPILNAATMLAQAGDRPDIRAMAVPLIQRQIKQMTHLIDDLLELSRMRHGRIVLRREPIDALHAVQEALEAVRPATLRLGHQVELHPPALPVHLDADPARLTQMLANLLGNAIKYTPPGGRIVVEIGREAGQGVLRFIDNGVGIAEEFLPRLFDMFTQDRQSIDRADGGLGLGLALVKRLAELHGGSIEVASGGRGQGSCFTLRLPLAEG